MYLSIILRALFMYFFIILVYRIMGKKEVGELSIIDLIVSILIAELASLCISAEKSVLYSVIPILVLVFVQILISFMSLKSEFIRDMIDGKPTIIIKGGKINFDEMKKLRYSLDDLLTQLRLQGIKSIENVKYAILENNGELSTFLDEDDYPMPLILDGVIDYNTLKEIKKDYNWIINLLKKKGYSLDEIFYAFYTNGKTFIITRNELL